jgi:hypothetical protein
MMRVGLYRPVHVKTLRSQKLRMLLSKTTVLARPKNPRTLQTTCKTDLCNKIGQADSRTARK